MNSDEFAVYPIQKYEEKPDVKIVSFDEIGPYLDLTDMTYVNRIGGKEELSLLELEDSIRRNKLLNPPIVIMRDDGYYIKVAGFRRLVVMQKIWMEENKQKELEFLVKILPKGISKEDLKAISLEENNCRKDLHKLEIVKAFHNDKKEFSEDKLKEIYGIKDRFQYYRYCKAAETLKYLENKEIDEIGITKLSMISKHISNLQDEGKAEEEIKEEILNYTKLSRKELREKINRKEVKRKIEIEYDPSYTEEELIEKLRSEIKRLRS